MFSNLIATFDLSRLARRGEGRTGEQFTQGLPLFRARTGIDGVSNERFLDRLAYYLANELAREPNLRAVQLTKEIVGMLALLALSLSGCGILRRLLPRVSPVKSISAPLRF